MEGYSFRPASPDDVHSVHQLISAQNILDYGDPLRSVEDIQRNWNAPSFDPGLDSQLAIAAGGEIAAYAELRGREDVFTYISSDHQDPKLAAHLLNFLEERARSLKSGTDPMELWGHAGFRN